MDTLRKVGLGAGAAASGAAGRDAAEQFGFVSHADLPQFDAAAEGAGKVFDQFAEIDAAFGRKIEDHLAAVEGEFAVDQLHVQLVLFDLFLRGLHGLRLALGVAPDLLAVAVGGDAQDGPQGLGDLGVFNLARDKGDARELDALARLHDDLHPLFVCFVFVGREPVHFSALFECYAYDFHHPSKIP